MTDTMKPFEFTNYDDHESVRPYFEGYLAARAAIEAEGGWLGNDSFRGRIPGIQGKREDTAIYMLQTMYRRDADSAKLAAAVDRGGIQITSLNTAAEPRGTLVCFGWYVGGTGYAEFADVRLRFERGRWSMYPPRARSPRYLPDGATLLIPGGAR